MRIRSTAMVSFLSRSISTHHFSFPFHSNLIYPTRVDERNRIKILTKNSHDRSLTYMNILRAAENLPPLTRKKCRDNYWADHCECFSRSGMLHKQLQKWMPKNMKYCSECSVFTKRRKSKKGRCEFSCMNVGCGM